MTHEQLNKLEFKSVKIANEKQYQCEDATHVFGI